MKIKNLRKKKNTQNFQRFGIIAPAFDSLLSQVGPETLVPCKGGTRAGP